MKSEKPINGHSDKLHTDQKPCKIAYQTMNSPHTIVIGRRPKKVASGYGQWYNPRRRFITMKKFTKWLLVSFLLLVAVAIIVPYASRGYLTRLALQKASEFLGAPVELSYAELNLFEGAVVLHGLKIYNPIRQKEIFTEADTIAVRLQYLPILKGKKGSLSVSIRHPQIQYRTNASGIWELKNKIPLLAAPASKEKTESPITIEKITIKNGAIHYFDGQVGKNILLSDFDLQLNHGASAPFHVNFLIDKQGGFSFDGKGDLLAEKISFEGDTALKKLPIVPFEPYYRNEKMPVEITGGTLTLTSRPKCQKNYIQAPVHAVIQELQIRTKQALLGTAAEDVLKELKNSDGNVVLDFDVAGDLYNPQFRVTTNLTQEFSKAFAKVLVREVPALLEKAKVLPEEIRSTVESLQKGDIKEAVEGGIGKLKGLFGK